MTAMSIQEIGVFAAVGLAVAYWLRGFVKLGRGKPGGCASGCGKCSAPVAEAPSKRIGLPQV